MFELWIPVTIAAAFFQNLRSAVQKHLKARLSDQGAAYARFLFAWPWAVIYLWALLRVSGADLPTLSSTFFLYCLAGGIAQIMATVLLLRTFAYRSFAVGTILSKLEVVVVAIIGTYLLGDWLTDSAKVAIAMSALGLLALSAGQQQLTVGHFVKGLAHRSNLLGLGSALSLGTAIVLFRGASVSIENTSVLIAAGVTLVVTLTIQTIAMGAYLLMAEKGQLSRVIRSWRWSGLAGLSGMLATACWFTAFTLQNASYVRALGQIELLFTFFVTARIFREDIHVLEVVGCFLIVAGIALLLLL